MSYFKSIIEHMTHTRGEAKLARKGTEFCDELFGNQDVDEIEEVEKSRFEINTELLMESIQKFKKTRESGDKEDPNTA